MCVCLMQKENVPEESPVGRGAYPSKALVGLLV